MAVKRGKDSLSFDFQWPYPKFKSVLIEPGKYENIVTRKSLFRIIWGPNQRALKWRSRWILNWERKTNSGSDEELLAEVNEVAAPFDCVTTELGPKSVGVQGDGRVFWPCVYVACPSHMSLEEIGAVSTKITNEVRGISKVLTYIVPE